MPRPALHFPCRARLVQGHGGEGFQVSVTSIGCRALFLLVSWFHFGGPCHRGGHFDLHLLILVQSRWPHARTTRSWCALVTTTLHYSSTVVVSGWATILGRSLHNWRVRFSYITQPVLYFLTFSSLSSPNNSHICLFFLRTTFCHLCVFFYLRESRVIRFSALVSFLSSESKLFVPTHNRYYR